MWPQKIILHTSHIYSIQSSMKDYMKEEIECNWNIDWLVEYKCNIKITNHSLSVDICYSIWLCPDISTLPIILLVLHSFFVSSHLLLIPLTLRIIISSILTYALCLVYWTIEYELAAALLLHCIWQLAYLPWSASTTLLRMIILHQHTVTCCFFSNSLTRINA